MEDGATPWLIAEATKTSGISPLWVWVTFLLGVAIVLGGGIVVSSG